MAKVKSVKSKSVKITLGDGVERNLKFDLNAMAEMEEKYGTVDKAFEVFQKGTVKGTRFMLWAGLVHEDESLTEKQVGSLIDLDNLEEIMSTLTKAFGEDMPDQTEAQAIAVSNPN